MTHDEKIAVIAAHRDGQPIQYKDRNDPECTWRQPGNITWNFDKFDYRVRPVPREWWIARDMKDRADVLNDAPKWRDPEKHIPVSVR